MSDYFKTLILKNFLCYKYGRFDFVPGVNMIIGPTDHGKSAMMDAFYKLLYNRPMGNDFQSWWMKNDDVTYIGLTVDNYIIKYHKDKTAWYELRNTKTKKTIPFEAVGRTVPNKITQLLQMDRKINIQKQLEKKAPIFLLSESNSDVAKHLNEVANLQGIDIALAAGKEDLGKDQKEKKKIDLVIKTKTTELKKYTSLDSLKILVTHAEKLEVRIQNCENEIEILSDSLDEIEKMNKKLAKIKRHLAPFPLIKKALIESEVYTKICDEQESFIEDLDEVKDLQDELMAIQIQLQAQPLVKRGVVLLQIISNYENEIDSFKNDLTSIKQAKTELKQLKKLRKETEKEFKKEFPDICPLCSSIVDKEKLV